ncbi:MAG: Rrf2 family transcriptional regulator [Novosphingobium sp.]|nr:Rrf2 family transcriptional regulator [Novosphingobium sp.]
MRLSSMADYAVVIMAAASRHCGCAIRESGELGLRVRLSAGQLAEETGLPAPTVQKLVSRLVAAGLLHSTRGMGGGIRLARPAAAITLADIVEAVEGPIAMTACLEEGRHECTLEEACSVRGHWPIVNEVLRDALAGVPLTRLAEAGQ